MTEKFCLRWNDFESSISSAFKDIRDEKDFFDVTLACDDEQVQAHKLILSACSPFFRKLLKTNSLPQTVIFLRGVKAYELVALMDLIYEGKANIFKDQLERFLALAEELELEGFSRSTEEKVSEVSKDSPKQNMSMNRNPWHNGEENTSIEMFNIIPNVKGENQNDKGKVATFVAKSKARAHIAQCVKQ